MNDTIAVVFARHGSKRLPDKHMLDVGGVPLVQHSLTTAKRVTDRVWTSTDDPGVMQVALKVGADVIKRPDKLATDRALIIDATLHAYQELKSLDWEYFVQLEGNTLYRRPMMVENILNYLKSLPYEQQTLIETVERCTKHYPQWTCKLDDRNYMYPYRDEIVSSNSVNFETIYHFCGAVQIYTRRYLEQLLNVTTHYVTLRNLAYPINHYDIWHVDDTADLEISRLICDQTLADNRPKLASIIGYPK